MQSVLGAFGLLTRKAIRSITYCGGYFDKGNALRGLILIRGEGIIKDIDKDSH